MQSCLSSGTSRTSKDYCFQRLGN